MRVGIIGCGKVALKGHIPAFKQLGLNVVGVADQNKVALEKANVKGKYIDYRELLKQNLDVVSICTPPFLHHQMCIDAAEKGLDILVEKPLAMSVEEGMEIKRKVEANGVKLSIVHNYKFMDPIMKAKKKHEDGQLGRLLSIHTIVHSSTPDARGTWSLDEEQAGSMVLELHHPLYLQTWFAGSPKSVFAIGTKILSEYPSVRDVKALISYNDCTGFLEMSQFCSASQFLLNITGTGASIAARLPVKFRMLAPDTSLDALEETFSCFTGLGRLLRMRLAMQARPYLGYTGGSHFRLIKRFVESIKYDVEVPASIDEGITSIKLAKAIEKSMYFGKKIEL